MVAILKKNADTLVQLHVCPVPGKITDPCVPLIVKQFCFLTWSYIKHVHYFWPTAYFCTLEGKYATNFKLT